MPIRRKYAPREVNAADLRVGRVDSHYEKILVRLLAAHAMAEKLTAFGYERALATCNDASAAIRLSKKTSSRRPPTRASSIAHSQKLASVRSPPTA